jgi:L-asparaginase II
VFYGGFYAGGELLAEVERNGLVESRHRGSVVVLGPDGTVAESVGDIQGAIFGRSSNKPLQAVGLRRAGLAFAGAHLALVCGSHRGEPFHIDAVRAMLASAGLGVEALGCYPDYPLSEEARFDVVRAGADRSRIYMNCSGKHAGMLATCVHNGWPTDGYLAVDHPVQLGLAATFADLVAEPVARTGVDGCGAPVFAASLTGLATAFRRLVEAEPGTHERAVADAMRAHPEMVSGTDADAVDTHVMRAIPGLIAKSGAEGLMAMAVPGAGAAVIKIDDGSMRPLRPILVSALTRLGVEKESVEQFATLPVTGGADVVGAVTSVW